MARLVCISFSLILCLAFSGFAFAQNNTANDGFGDIEKQSIQDGKAKTLEEFDANVFFTNNLIPAERFFNQIIAYQDDEDIEFIDMLVDPRTGAVLYIVVSQDGWLGIGGDKHVVPFEALQLESKSRQLAIDEGAITLSEKTLYDPQREGRWGSEEVASYCKNTGLENIMEQTRQEMGRTAGRNAGGDAQIVENLECLIEVSRLHNREVEGQHGETLGELQAFLLDTDDARIKLVVMDHGSLLGLQGDSYLIPWEAMQLDPLGRNVRLLVTEANLEKFSNAKNFGWNGSILPKDRGKEVYSLYKYDYTLR